MKKCRRYLLLMLGILLVCVLAPMSVHAAESNGSSINDWEYTSNSDGSITLTRYKGTSQDIVIPGKLDGQQVKIASFSNAGVKNGNSLVVGTPEEKVIYDNTSLSMAFFLSTLQRIDLSGLDTSRVTDMQIMFDYASELQELDLGDLNTSKVTNMRRMFSMCSKLKKLDVSNLDTSKVKDMYEMFVGCSGLKELDVSNFNTSEVTNIGGMFVGCSGLTKLDVSNFDTSKATQMDHIFADCSELTTLELGSNFNAVNIPANRGDDPIGAGIFDGCNKLQFIDLPVNIFPKNYLRVFDTSAGKSLPTAIITQCDDVKNYSPDAGKTLGNERIPYTATVKLDANGGTFAEKAADTEKTITLGGGNIFYDTVDAYKNEFTVTGDKIADATANPARGADKFTGWYLDKDCTKPFTTLDMTVGHDSEVTLYAGYGDKKPGTDKPGTNTPAGGNGSNAGNPVQKVIKAVQTGDVSSPYFWAAVAIVAMIGAAVTVLVRRKHLYRS